MLNRYTLVVGLVLTVATALAGRLYLEAREKLGERQERIRVLETRIQEQEEELRQKAARRRREDEAREELAALVGELQAEGAFLRRQLAASLSDECSREPVPLDALRLFCQTSPASPACQVRADSP